MAYPNLSFETSVAGNLAQAKASDGGSMYRENGVLPQENLQTVRPDGSTAIHILAQIDFKDLKIFADELDIALKLQDPHEQALFAKNIVSLANLVRGVNYNTRSGFKGAVGQGLQLDAIRLREGQFQNPDSAVVAARTTWQRAIAGAGTLQFICAADALGANAHGALTTGTNEAIALLGFINVAKVPLVPCSTVFQPQYLGVNYNIQNLDFEGTNTQYGDPVIELKQPLLIWPGENALVTVYYYQAGTDWLKPIGLWIKTASNLRTLATS